MALTGSLVSFLAAAILGILSGLGLGGGSLLLLWMTVVAELDPMTAREISLLFFFPASLLSIILHRQEKGLWKKLLPAAAAGLISAFFAGKLAQILPPQRYGRAMGVLLILLGLQQILERPKK